MKQQLNKKSPPRKPIARENIQSKPRLSFLSNAIRLGIVGLSLTQGTAHAIPIVVTSLLDGTATNCTLRDAIVSINERDLQADCEFANVVGTELFDSIIFASSLSPSTSTITLVGGQLSVNPDTDFTIYGDGITVSANNQSRVFFASSATLTINNMTITGGSASIGAGMYAGASNVELVNTTVSANVASSRGGGLFVSDASIINLRNSTLSGNSANGEGGGFYVESSDVGLSNSVLSGNHAVSGGGFNAQSSSTVSMLASTLTGNSTNGNGGGFLAKASEVSLVASTLSNNTAFKGGGSYVRNVPNLRINNSVLTGNVSRDGGGGVMAISSILSVEQSTLSGNSAGYGGGGGVAAYTSNVKLRNSTLSANSAYRGGGVNVVTSSFATIESSTLSDNFSNNGAGGLSVSSNATVVLNNSIVANSRAASDCFLDSSTFTSDGASIIEDGSCTKDARSVDPGLLPLENNGGRTKTHALSASSPARNSGVQATCTLFDQRGQQRFSSGDPKCDVGAIEFNPNDDSSFFVIPLNKGKAVVVPL